MLDIDGIPDNVIVFVLLQKAEEITGHLGQAFRQ